MRMIDADEYKKCLIDHMTVPWERAKYDISDDYNKGLYDAVRMLNIEPTIEPMRKRGKWVKMPEFRGDDVSGFVDNHFSCSECKKEAEINFLGFYILSDFCPNCGADMREVKTR